MYLQIQPNNHKIPVASSRDTLGEEQKVTDAPPTVEIILDKRELGELVAHGKIEEGPYIKVVVI